MLAEQGRRSVGAREHAPHGPSAPAAAPLTRVDETITAVHMSGTVTVQTRVDPQLKRDVDQILATLGLDMPTAIRVFLTRVRHISGIPFPLTTSSPRLAAAIDEADRLMADPAAPVYTDVQWMMREILQEPDALTVPAVIDPDDPRDGEVVWLVP